MTAALVCLLLCSHLEAQRVRHLEWRDVVLQEKARTFQALMAKAQWRQALSLGQKLVDEDLTARIGQDGRMIWPLMAAEDAPGLYLSPGYFVARALAGAPQELKTLYLGLFGERAEDALRSAEMLRNPSALEHLSRRYAITPAGLKARELLAHMALEKGDGLAAARLFGDLLDLGWGQNAEIPGWQAGLALALHRLNDAVSLGELRRQASSRSIQIAEKQTTLDWLLSSLAPVEDVEAVQSLAAPRAGADLQTTALRQLWTRSVTTTQGMRVHPVMAGNRLVFHDWTSATALNLKTGAVLWRHPWVGSFQEHTVDLRGAADDSLYVAAIPQADQPGNRVNRLVAISLKDGRTLWTHGGHELGDADLPPLHFHGAALLQSGRVFVTASGPGRNRPTTVLCFSAASGRLLWATGVGSGVPLTLRRPGPEETLHAPGALPPGFSQGFLICCDNLGHIALLEADTGRPRLLITYPRRRLTAKSRSLDGALPQGWQEGPVWTAGSRYVVAAEDSDQLQAFFLRPPSDPERRRRGRLWVRAATLKRGDMEQVLGLDGADVLVRGRDAHEALSYVARIPLYVNAGPHASWMFPLDTPGTGRGYLGQTQVYISSEKYIYAMERAEGLNQRVLISRESEGKRRLGHILVLPQGMIVASPDAITFFGPGTTGNQGR